MPLTARDVIDLLALEPLPQEGGYFRQLYKAVSTVTHDFTDGVDGAETRSVATSIYYLVTEEAFSALHRVRGIEFFHFYLGDSVELVQIDPSGALERVRLGHNLRADERPQAVVPPGVWQGLRLTPGGRFALLGTTVAPGFEYHDFTLGSRAELIARFPEHAETIRAYTREGVPT
jgi:predicted cupin superfamily sugar epimerase